MKYGYIIEWFDECWIAKGEGDPCRTLVLNSAQVFKSVSAAKARITRESNRLKYRDFGQSKIRLIQISNEVIETVSER